MSNEGVQNIGIVIPVRMPGKALEYIVGREGDPNAKTLLEVTVERLRQCKRIRENSIIVAMPEEKDEKNKPIIEECRRLGVIPFEGSTEYMERSYQAAMEHHLEGFAIVAPDFQDPKIVDELIRVFEEDKLDFITNVDNTNVEGHEKNISFAPFAHVAVIKVEALGRAIEYKESNPELPDTAMMLSDPENFKLGYIRNHRCDNPGINLRARNTDRDMELVREVASRISDIKTATYEDIVQTIRQDSDLLEKISQNPSQATGNFPLASEGRVKIYQLDIHGKAMYLGEEYRELNGKTRWIGKGGSKEEGLINSAPGGGFRLNTNPPKPQKTHDVPRF